MVVGIKSDAAPLPPPTKKDKDTLENKYNL